MPSNETHQEQPVPELSSRERDALDDMIEAAKAVKNLVSVDTLSMNMTADPTAASGPSGGRLCRSKRLRGLGRVRYRIDWEERKIPV
jgi:hypothetical protein